jgi:hypothetical protein
VADVGNSLTKAFDYVWGRFLGRLEGLGDAEYFWEPVPGCWSVRQGADGRWVLDGGGAPEPAPVTTIAWRIGPSFGPYAKDSATDLALHVFDELVHHAAEVSLLRDLYLRKDQLGR